MSGTRSSPIRDVWELELGQGSNHLFSSIFATILDFEKEM